LAWRSVGAGLIPALDGSWCSGNGREGINPLPYTYNNALS